MYHRRAVKRYGENNLEADPNWIKQVLLLKKGETPPSGAEAIDKIALRNELRLQKADVELWLKTLNTEMSRIDKNWKSNYSDYKSARVAMKGAYEELGGWDSLTFQDKGIAARWFIVDDDKIDEMCDLNGRLLTGNDFNFNSTTARQKRFSTALNFLRNVLEKDDLNSIIYDIKENRYVEDYINYGIEGTMKTNYQGETDSEGLFDYVKETSETEYKKNSLASRISTPKFDYTVQEVVDKVYDILDIGDY